MADYIHPIQSDGNTDKLCQGLSSEQVWHTWFCGNMGLKYVWRSPKSVSVAQRLEETEGQSTHVLRENVKIVLHARHMIIRPCLN